MNLYEIMLEHYAPKDSEKGILTYLVANSDEEVYEWLKKDIKLKDGRRLYTSYYDREDDNEGEVFEIYDENYNVVGTETYREKIIKLKGDMFDEDEELSDLYYGETFTGWRLVKEGISESEIKIIEDCGISIEIALN